MGDLATRKTMYVIVYIINIADTIKMSEMLAIPLKVQRLQKTGKYVQIYNL